jgi:hypothetical protein
MALRVEDHVRKNVLNENRFSVKVEGERKHPQLEAHY